ncbi:MAG: 16S rRNA (guanine(966)-N(2))-methyltransferase RsmD [Johnsonella sp.]|nr:16S rRNA (guanine(966)-N(2))-methyltransferase RsmD [Johnsonella sp.]
MRVIAGSARRLLLKTVEGKEVRPTTDRIKETLFNILQDKIEGCIFLDLFAGSGAIGIEALSRGAKKAFFVDKDRRALSCIEENLRHTKLEERAKILRMDALTALNRLEKTEKEAFDIVFIDPPYEREEEEEILKRLIKMDLINQESLIIIELSKKTETEDLLKEWDVLKIKEYKSNKHVFIRRRQENVGSSLSGQL